MVLDATSSTSVQCKTNVIQDANCTASVRSNSNITSDGSNCISARCDNDISHDVSNSTYKQFATLKEDSDWVTLLCNRTNFDGTCLLLILGIFWLNYGSF